MTGSVKTVFEGSVARILLDRAHRRNALDRRTGAALMGAVEEVADRDDVAVVVLEGAGDHFCAGWDLSEFGWLAGADDRRVESYLAANLRLLRLLAGLPQFTVALVQGYAVGFGAALAFSADLAVADPRARFHFPEAGFGLVPAVVLPALVESAGARAALWSTLTAAPLPADRALALGMVGLVADPAQRQRLLERLAELSPGVVRSTKRLVVEISTAPPGEVEQKAVAAGVATLRSEEAAGTLGAG